MTTELEITKLEDPFHHSSSFSLLPKTLADRSCSSRLDTTENLFKPLVAKGSPKIMQQAQILSNSFSDIDSLYKEDEIINANYKNHGQERRPALGRKRARFSIRPNVPSYSKPDTEISMNIDNIDDPDEYFRAFERMQNAERELNKLRGGVLIDVMQQDQATKTRIRRPGLLGKKASYKHHISEDDAMAETLAKIQEKHHDALNCSSSLINTELVGCSVSQSSNTNSKLQEAERKDSIAEKENGLDDLISYKNLDGGEDETYMQEILHLKPIDVGKIHLPVLPNIQFNQQSAPKHTTHAVSELLKNLSPSIKSPLVSVSTFLQKRLSIKNLQNDILSSFSNEDAAYSPDSSSSKSAGKKPLINDKLESGDDSCSPVVETEGVTELSKNSHSLHDRNTNPKSIGARNRKHSILDDSCGDLQGDDMQHDPFTFDESEPGVERQDSQPKTQEVFEDACHLFGETAKDDFNASKIDNNVPHTDGQLCADDGNHPNELLITNEAGARDEITVPNTSEKTTSETNIDKSLYEVDANLQNNMPDVRTSQEVTIVPNQHLENQHELPNNNTEENALVPPSNKARKQKAPKRAPNKRKYSRKQNVAGNSHPPEVTDISNLPSENQQVLPAQNNEHQVASTPPSNELRKQKAPPRSQNRKKYTRRQSLAGAGTVWENGRRKSSRQRFRPLEHWLGERLLFGRIHNSLATVIGVKYASPGKNHLKVESYVADEFADLVAKAAT